MIKKMLKSFYRILKKNYYLLRAITRTPLKEVISYKPVYLFNHVPKCGGTTLLNILNKWFEVVRDYPPHDLKYSNAELLESKMEFYISHPVEILKFKPWQILAGHYHVDRIHLNQRYHNVIANSRVQIITFLRDPLEHRLSLYYYNIKRKHKWMLGVGLKQFVMSHSNFFAKALQCDEVNYKEVLSAYFFVGLVEEYETSLTLLSTKLKRPFSGHIPHLNKVERKRVTEDELIDVNEFKKLNSLDYLMYEYARRLLVENNIKM